MKHLDLFSGIGGFALAARWAGLETIGFCEKDEFCQKVINKHWPGVPIFSDIKELTGDQLKSDGIIPDIITGGFPCQSFSCAGQQRGKGDDRYLWPEMFRVIREIHPAWVIGENVRGIVNMALDEVISNLESVGYETATFIIPACGVDAPHRRDRVWIIGRGDDVAHSSEPRIRDQCREAGNKGRGRSKEGGESIRQGDREAGPSGSGSAGSNAVANTMCDRGEAGIPKEEAWRQRYSEIINDGGCREGGCGDVANTEGDNEGGRSEKAQAGEQDSTKRTGKRCGDVPDTNGDGLEGGRERGNNEGSARLRSGAGKDQEQCLSERELQGENGEGESFAESFLGGLDDGIPTQLFRPRRWQDEPPIPRVASGIVDRKHKLRGLGNAVVPHIPYILFEMIKELTSCANAESRHRM